jgi:hypothetical protein
VGYAVNQSGMRRTTEAAPSAGFTATIGPAPPWHSDEVEHTASIWGRPISALCNARTLPLIAAGIEFAIVSTAAFGAGAVYHQFVFGQLPFAAYYLAATLLLTGLFVLSSGLRPVHNLRNRLLFAWLDCCAVRSGTYDRSSRPAAHDADGCTRPSKRASRRQSRDHCR